ncbi:MarR family transcriptional regulator [Nocardioides lentus]|uniref:MarR family transcriptional regulator n=1 Tax=Nocardioides lentus TaxID=338077 RepID=A0ABP5B530_9ACTN
MSDEGPWLGDAEQCVWRQWTTLDTLLPAALGRQLQADSGLSLPDFAVLVQLSESEAGRVRVSELGQMLTWEKSRTSHHLTRMEKRGLVGREQCPDDARGAFVAITPAGREAIEQAAPGHACTVRRLVFDHLTPDEVRVLGEVYAGVLARLAATEQS